MTLEVQETTTPEEADLSNYSGLGLKAEILHNDHNGELDTKEHTVVLGDTVIFLEESQ